MAIANAYAAVNMDTAQTWDGYVTASTATHIQVTWGAEVQNYYGSFTYDADGLAGGTVTSSNYYVSGVKMYDISGGSYSALKVESYLDAGDMSGLLAYVFGGSDTLNGSAQADAINGFAGNDSVRGNGGNDLLKGGAGNDILNGGTGADTMQGGTGNDSYYVDSTSDRVVEGSGAGTDMVYSSVASHTLAAYVENGRILATGSANMTGNSLGNTIHAGVGNNVVSAGGGIDTLSYAYGASGTLGVKVSLATTTAQATGGSGTDTVSGFENLTGSANRDRLDGNSGANTLRGGGGSDTLSGSSGNDALYGDAGNDILGGGTGNDVLRGGTGRDVFRFDTALSTATVQNLDRIADFVAADDTIQLENAIFTRFGTTTGTLASASFKSVASGGATDANDYIVYERTSGALFYDRDGGADGYADGVQIATIGTNLALTNADFVLI